MFEKEAEERCSRYFEENCYKKNKWADTHDLVIMWQDGAEFGYEQGIARLRYCCTCKKYYDECLSDVKPYGICADWEIENKECTNE